MTGATCGLGNAHSSGTPDFTPFHPFIIYTLQSKDYVYELMTRVCLPGLVWTALSWTYFTNQSKLSGVFSHTCVETFCSHPISQELSLEGCSQSRVGENCRFSTGTFWRLVFSHTCFRINLQWYQVGLEINSEPRVWEYQSPKCWVGELCSLSPYYSVDIGNLSHRSGIFPNPYALRACRDFHIATMSIFINVIKIDVNKQFTK